ncbi:type II secretion system GspH family protein [Candidatus Woesebacteria bacterium]|nr:type II secretion system GspH family protein [Candidatus Woesebacteria bacterium]
MIELMVVISIIGILTAAIGGNYMTSRVRARDSERKNALSQIRNALEIYFNDHGHYPEAIDGKILGLDWGGPLIDSNTTTYMVQLPSDSRAPNTQYYYEVDGTDALFTDQLKYRLYARLENPNDADTDLDGDGDVGDEYDGTNGDGQAKYCGDDYCNYGIPAPTTTMEEVW